MVIKKTTNNENNLFPLWKQLADFNFVYLIMRWIASSTPHYYNIIRVVITNNSSLLLHSHFVDHHFSFPSPSTFRHPFPFSLFSLSSPPSSNFDYNLSRKFSRFHSNLNTSNHIALPSSLLISPQMLHFYTFFF